MTASGRAGQGVASGTSIKPSVPGGTYAWRTPDADRALQGAHSSDKLLDWIGSAFIWGSASTVSGLALWLLPIGWFLFVVIATMMATIGLFVLVEPPLRGQMAERCVRGVLRKHGVPAVHDLVLSTPDGRRAQFDHVVFLGRTVAVIETKSIEGVVERRNGRWSRWVNGRERSLGSRTPQQQVMGARDVLAAAYPAWGRGILAWTVVAHGTLGEGLAGDAWVIGLGQVPLILGRFRQQPDTAGERRWQDLERFLRANRRTRRDKWRFLTREVFDLSTLGRSQLFGIGLAYGAGVPLVFGLIWLAIPKPGATALMAVFHHLFG